ncbi:MAG: dihydroorotate dehydrogenase-like protein [Bacteroidales bacterium]|nr:dihydroorotate dehydrogenase-like protein [Bacteroidales bacterium]
MANISTKYLGLDLKSPIIVGSSPLTDSVEKVKKLAEAGAGAVVLKSLFEEQILMDVDAQRVNNMYNSFGDAENYLTYYTKQKSIGDYLELIKDCKRETSIPIIASINCMSHGEWVEFALKMQNAGADALELNVFVLPADAEYTGFDYEKSYFDIISQINDIISIPVAVKMSHYFSGMANFFTRLSQTDIKGLVLFNRFYSPDVDIEKEKVINLSFNSLAVDNSMVLRWVGILAPKVACDLVSSTGIVDGNSVIKNMLVGAKAVQVVSSIIKNGPNVIAEMNQSLETWMDSKNYKTTKEFIGKLSQKNIRKPILFERTQFMKYFSDADFVNL